tara:strand:+ start:2420 stop:3010 length:591 start_codon:yes stop_codon:yes gene_type:complete
MALSKIQAESMNLADTFAFTGTVSGTGINLLLDTTISSAVSEYDISSAYINSTYDSYYLESSLLPATDSAYPYLRVFVGGSVVTTGKYGYEAQNVGGSSTLGSNATSTFALAHHQVGNADGEGYSSVIWIRNVNSTTRPFSISGATESGSTAGNPSSSVFGGSFLPANRADVVNGLRLWVSGGNIASGTVKLYGLR